MNVFELCRNLEARKGTSNLVIQIFLLKLCCIVQDDETALMQGVKEAEKMIVEAYAALLLAFLSTERFVHL